MKNMKKFASVALVLVMTIALMVPVMAAEAQTGSITVNNAIAGKIFTAYRIFDMTLEGEGENASVAYTINEKWAGFFNAGAAGAGYIVGEQPEGKELNQIVVNGDVKYINITEDNVADFANAAQGYLTTANNGVSATVPENATAVTIKDLPLGYYLVFPESAEGIKEGNGSMCSLTSTVPDNEVVVKSVYPTIKKDGPAIVELGQNVNYTITGKVPDTTGYSDDYKYIVTDTMSDGLTFNADVSNFKVTIDGTEIDITDMLEYTGNGFKLTLDMCDYQEHEGKNIVITYSAVVNENAIDKTNVNAEENKASLTYGHGPEENLDKTPDEIVKTKTITINISKYDMEDEETKLEGATFILRKAGTEEYYVRTGNVVTWGTKDQATSVTTDANGGAAFEGLKDGDYELIETEAPAGYNLLTAPVKVKVTADATVQIEGTATGEPWENAADSTVSIGNSTGAELPSTGGIGTTIFYIVGGALVVGAAILLVTRKRVKVEQ